MAAAAHTGVAPRYPRCSRLNICLDTMASTPKRGYGGDLHRVVAQPHQHILSTPTLEK